MRSEEKEVSTLVARVMEDLRITRTPVYVQFTDTSERAESTRERYPRSPVTITISTRKAIRRLMPELSEEEIRAKQVWQVSEEFCHFGVHEDCHPKRVTSCTIRTAKRNMTKRQRAAPLSREKVEALRQVSEVRGLGCPKRDE